MTVFFIAILISSQITDISDIQGKNDIEDGDIIYLTNDATIRGLFVLRETPAYIELFVYEGQPPLRIPKRLIQKIEYNKTRLSIEPVDSGTNDQARELVFVPGHEMSSDLIERLSRDISRPEWEIQEKDVLDVLKELSSRTGIRIIVDRRLTEIPVEHRTCHFAVHEGMTALEVLNSVRKHLDMVTIFYVRDEVRIIKRKNHEIEEEKDTDDILKKEQPDSVE